MAANYIRKFKRKDLSKDDDAYGMVAKGKKKSTKKNRKGLSLAKANNIRRLSESGHQLVIDDNDPRKLKIIKQFRPRA